MRYLFSFLFSSASAKAFAILVTPVLGNDESISDQLEKLSPLDADEVLWLARCIYSESDRPHEQELVAWVVRNRVETAYRGSTYRDATLEPFQFSAFNDDTPRRRYLLRLDFSNRLRSWQNALEIALNVYQAPSSERPFALTVRHFYSPISMSGRLVPLWAEGQKPLDSDELGVNSRRFQFYDNVDDNGVADSRTVSADESRFRHVRTPGVRNRMGRSTVPRPLRPSVSNRLNR